MNLYPNRKSVNKFTLFYEYRNINNNTYEMREEESFDSVESLNDRLREDTLSGMLRPYSIMFPEKSKEEEEQEFREIIDMAFSTVLTNGLTTGSYSHLKIEHEYHKWIDKGRPISSTINIDEKKLSNIIIPNSNIITKFN